MKGWSLVSPNNIEEKEVNDSAILPNYCKVKITKALISIRDVLKFNGEIPVDNKIIGSFGTGVVSESEPNLFGLEKGKHVYIDPFVPCNKCFNCVSNNKQKCSNIGLVGEDLDGYLADFITINSENVYPLPDSISDFDSLFIGHISLALSVIDKLQIQKGDYVAIVGANNFGIILSQLLIYYQAVPIILSDDESDIEIAKNSGVYYAFGPDDNWQKEVSSITGGRMTKSVVYICDCDIHTSKAFSLASFNADFAFTGVYTKNNQFSFNQALKKQLVIHCVNSGYGNASASINLLANKAVDLSHLKFESCSYNEIPKTIKKMADKYDNNEKIYNVIVDLI